MKYTPEDVMSMRGLAHSIAAIILIAQNNEHKLSASDYEVATLAETVLQTYIAAGISLADLKKTAQQMQKWVNE